MPDRNQIASFYPPGYWQENTKQTLLSRLQRIYIDTMLKFDLMRWVSRLKLNPKGVFLDIGCSRGDWLDLIRSKGWAVAGVEADPRAAAFAKDRLNLPIENVDVESWSPQEGAYKVISFFHLLEHVSSPHDFLAKVRKALVKDGKILLRVPNAGSAQLRWFGKRWKGLEMPRHIHMFNPYSLKLLLQSQGFEIEASSTWSLRDGPPALTSSLFPAGEPTRQEILRQPRPIATMIYLILNWLMTPLEVLCSLFGQGAMITVIARIREPS